MDGNRELKNALNKDGYSNEEKYFHDLNRELVSKQKLKRTEVDSQSAKETKEVDRGEEERQADSS